MEVRIKEYKCCQSCGLPLSDSELNTNTQPDKNGSRKYCLACFNGGKFTLPNITQIQMKKIIAEKLKKDGYSEFIIDLFMQRIHTLERWRKNSKV